MKDLYILNSLGVADLPFERQIGTREDWAALGVEITDRSDIYGIVARYRGGTGSVWLAERRRDGLVGQLWGSCPLQGYGAVDGHPFYFRARHDHWSLTIAETLDLDPINTPYFVWGGEYANASYMEEDVGWQFVEEAIAVFRDPLMQELLRDPTATTPEAYRASRCWHALAYAAAQAGGPVEHIRRTLWTFGIHPVMDLDGEGRVDWGLYVEHTIEPTTHAAQRTAFDDAFDAAVCDAIRAVWIR